MLMHACMYIQERKANGKAREATAAPYGGRGLPGPDLTCDHEHTGVNTGGHDQVPRAAISN